jgi:hypothetical protein
MLMVIVVRIPAQIRRLYGAGNWERVEADTVASTSLHWTRVIQQWVNVWSSPMASCGVGSTSM